MAQTPHAHLPVRTHRHDEHTRLVAVQHQFSHELHCVGVELHLARVMRSVGDVHEQYFALGRAYHAVGPFGALLTLLVGAAVPKGQV